MYILLLAGLPALRSVSRASASPFSQPHVSLVLAHPFLGSLNGHLMMLRSGFSCFVASSCVCVGVAVNAVCVYSCELCGPRRALKSCKV